MSFFSTKSFFFFLTLCSSYLPSEYKFILYSFFIFMMVGWVVVMYDFVNSRLKSHLLNHVRIEGTIIYNLSPFSVACFKHSDQLMHFPMQIILPFKVEVSILPLFALPCFNFAWMDLVMQFLFLKVVF